jgi:hypothetical protein
LNSVMLVVFGVLAAGIIAYGIFQGGFLNLASATLPGPGLHHFLVRVQYDRDFSADRDHDLLDSAPRNIATDRLAPMIGLRGRQLSLAPLLSNNIRLLC